MTKVITLLSLGFIAWYWSHSQALKQFALRASKRRCDEAGLQLLDHTVVLHRFTFQKDKTNRWRIMREYRFEFTSTGENRYMGRLLLQGKQLAAIELEPYTLN